MIKVKTTKPSQTEFELSTISMNLIRIADDQGDSLVIGRTQALEISEILRLFSETGEIENG